MDNANSNTYYAMSQSVPPVTVRLDARDIDEALAAFAALDTAAVYEDGRTDLEEDTDTCADGPVDVDDFVEAAGAIVSDTVLSDQPEWRLVIREAA